MSANNQTLILLYKGKYYVFENIMAESWTHYDDSTKQFDDNRVNEISLSSARGTFDTYEEANDFAQQVDDEDPTEYGVVLNALIKDDSSLNII